MLRLRYIKLNEIQPVDVKGDIEIAKNSAQLFSQTLSFTDPTVEDISKNELIQVFKEKEKEKSSVLKYMD